MRNLTLDREYLLTRRWRHPPYRCDCHITFMTNLSRITLFDRRARSIMSTNPWPVDARPLVELTIAVLSMAFSIHGKGAQHVCSVANRGLLFCGPSLLWLLRPNVVSALGTFNAHTRIQSLYAFLSIESA